MEAAPAFDAEPAPTGTPPADSDEPEPDVVDDTDAPQAPQWRRLLRFAVPVGVALYILISSALNH